MNAPLFLSILIALVCAEPARFESLHGKVEETQDQAEVAKANLLLEQMKHSFRNADGIESVFNQLEQTLNKLDTRTSTLVSDVSTIKSELASQKSTVASVKSSVNTLKSKQVRCQSNWNYVKGTDLEVTYSPAFSAKPALIIAFNRINFAGAQKWAYYTEKTATSFKVGLAGAAADKTGTNEFTWMACGH